MTDPRDDRHAAWQLAAMEAKEFRKHTTQLRWAVVRHAMRGLLGATPVVLAFMPRFRIGVLAWLLVPLLLYVHIEARQAVATYRELQAALRSERQRGRSGPDGPAP